MFHSNKGFFGGRYGMITSRLREFVWGLIATPKLNQGHVQGVGLKGHIHKASFDMMMMMTR